MGLACPIPYEEIKDSRNLAFAARSEAEFWEKTRAWKEFYFHVFAPPSKKVYVAPHCGDITRSPDPIISVPWLKLDAYTARIASLCALQDKGEGKKIMFSIHSNGFIGAAMDLGDFGIWQEGELQEMAEKLNHKYRKAIGEMAPEYKEDALNRILWILEDIIKRKGTLVPEKLVSTEDKLYLDKLIRWLGGQGQAISAHTMEEFREKVEKALVSFNIEPLSVNQIFSGRHTARLLKLKEKLTEGLLDRALQIECQKFFLKHRPHLMAEIILELSSMMVQ